MWAFKRSVPTVFWSALCSVGALSFVDHDLTEHGAKQPGPAVGDAVRLDVDEPAPDGATALQV